MLSLTSKRLLFSGNLSRFSQRARLFSTINVHTLDSAITGASNGQGNFNFSQFFSSLNPSHVEASDAKSVGKLLQVLSIAGTSEEVAKQTELLTAIEDYFRKQYRLLKTADAVDMLEALGKNPET